jgi:hypothetical protein
VRFGEKRLILRFLRFSLSCVRFLFDAFEAKITLFPSFGRSDQKGYPSAFLGFPMRVCEKGYPSALGRVNPSPSLQKRRAVSIP